MQSHGRRAVASSLVACAAIAWGFVAWGGSGWLPGTPNNDSDTDTKNCGAIVDTYGAITSWTTTSGAHDVKTTAAIGAHWNGTEPMLASEPQNNPPKDNTSEHYWNRDGGTTYKYLTVNQISTPGATGTCGQQNPQDPQWWFTPTVTVNDQPPKLYYDSQGEWVEQGFDSYDPNNTPGTATVSVVVPPGQSQGTAQSGGTLGTFAARKTLPNTTDHAKILFKYRTVCSATVDNAWVSNIKGYLSADCRSKVMDTQ